jgi:DNA-binding CsgD family transcriptional regulator
MERLRQRDFRALIECVGRLYAHHDLDTFGVQALSLSRVLIPAAYGTYNGMNFRLKKGWYFTDPAGLDFGFSRADMARITGIHPLMLHYRDTGNAEPRKLSDFLSRPRYRESALYRDHFGRIGVEQMMGMYLPQRPPDKTALALIRDNHRDFTERERLLWNLARPHFFQACGNAELISGLREQAVAGEQTLDSTRVGLVVIGRGGLIPFCSAKARQWLATYFEKPPRPGQLPETLRRWVVRQQLPSSASASLPHPRQPLVMDREGRRLTIRLLPESAPGRQLLVLQERLELSAPLLRRFGLTPREAEVLLWVAQGKTNPEIGTILGLSAGTIHKHTEHIYEKLGVETRTAAAARAYETLTDGAGGD